MLTTRIAHMLYEPKHCLDDADRAPANPIDIVLHIAFLALIPTVCGYIATVHIGWDIGAGDPYLLSASVAFYIAIAAYIAFNVGVYAMGFAIYWLAQTFDVKPDPLHCIELAILTSVPLFLTGFMALYPVLYIDVMVGMVALAASVYLLYVGVPIFMHIPKEAGFIYSTWVVTLGLIMLVVFFGLSVFIFSALT
jgi:hypothetical protein